MDQINKVKYNIVPINKNDNDAVLISLKKYYFRDEPLNACTRLFEDDISVRKLESFCIKYIQNGLSFMAISESGEVLGVILNDKSCRDTVKKYDVDDSSDESSKFNNIMVLLDKIQKEVDVYGKNPNVDRIMHIKIISVNDAYRGQGICKSFVAKTKEMALKEGCQMIDVECSSLYTAKTAERFGFQCVYSLSYKDYVDDQGEVVFKVHAPHEYMKIYVLLL